MVGPFSDSPQYLLDEYFTKLAESLRDPVVVDPTIVTLWGTVEFDSENVEFTDDDYLSFDAVTSSRDVTLTNGHLVSPRSTIIANGSRWTDMYAKIDEHGFKRIRVQPVITEDVVQQNNLFKFTKRDFDDTDVGTTIKNETTTNAAYIKSWEKTDLSETVAMSGGLDVYIRKDSFFHDWFINNKKTDHENFLNDNKRFARFGTITPIQTEAKKWFIEHLGLKDFSYRALPENNRNDRLRLFLKIFFDQVYQECYNMMKNLWTLYDPEEININILNFFVKFYAITLDNYYMDDDRKREFAKNLISFLKRKGSIGSLYTIWKIITRETKNQLRVYECWHPTWPTSGSPMDVVEDIEYIKFYENDPSYPTDYSVGGKILSTHYKVVCDLNTEPFGEPIRTDQTRNYIINSDIALSLLEGWETLRPITKCAHYYESALFRGDFSGRKISFYKEPYRANWATKCLTALEVLQGCTIQVQYSAITDLVCQHNLGHTDIVLQCYDIDYKRVYPASINIVDSMRARLVFDEPFRGAVFVKIADKDISLASLDSWDVRHALGTLYNNYMINQNGEVIVPNEITAVDTNNATITFYDNESGHATINSYDYIVHQSAASTTWEITHALGYQALLVEVYDDSTHAVIVPSSITLTDDMSCTVEFETPVSGYFTAKMIGNPAFREEIGLKLIGGYYKLGSGTDVTYNARYYNDVQTPIYTGTNITWTEVTPSSGPSYYLAEFEVPNGSDLNITEIGIFDVDSNIAFYSIGSLIFKPSEMGFKGSFKIYKEDIDYGNVDIYYS